MRDPFRSNSKARLIREAQVGLTVVAILLTLLLYIAFYKITGRGRHLPEHVRNAPIAQTVWSDAPSGHDYRMSPNTDLDNGDKPIENTNSYQKTPGNPPDKAADRLQIDDHPTINHHVVNSASSIDTGVKHQFGQLDSRNHPTNSASSKTIMENKSATRVARSLNSFIAPFVPAQQTEAPQPESMPIDVVMSKTSSKSELEPTSKETTSFETNNLRSAHPPLPNVKSFSPNPFEPPSKVQLTSAESSDNEIDQQNDLAPTPNSHAQSDSFPKPLRHEMPVFSTDDQADQSTVEPHRDVKPEKLSPVEVKPIDNIDDSHSSGLEQTSVISTSKSVATGGSWLDNSQSQVPSINSPSTLTRLKIPTMESPKPLPHQSDGQPQRLPRLVQEDIARAVFSGDANQSLETEMPSSRSPSGTKPPPMTFVVGEGDSYWSIAQVVYNDGRYFRALYEHNKSVTPDFEVLPGTILVTPAKSDLIKLWPNQCPREASFVRVDGTQLDETENSYLTQQGDTLFEIARQKLGQASRFSDIHDANRARLDGQIGPNTRLRKGLRLVLPAQ